MDKQSSPRSSTSASKDAHTDPDSRVAASQKVAAGSARHPHGPIDDPVDELESGLQTPIENYRLTKSGTELEAYIEDIADTVRIGLDQSIAILTPWFFNNMPSVYYQTTPRPEKVRHLSAIITGHVFETKQTVELWDRDRSKVTFIGPGGENSILVDMAQRLGNLPLKMGSLYFSRDNLLFLSTFFCRDHREIDQQNVRITRKIEEARRLMNDEFPGEAGDIEHYLKHLDNEFVMYATPARIQITYRMVRHMLTHEGAHTIVEPLPNSSAARMFLGMKDIQPSDVLEQILYLVNRYGFHVVRSFVVKFEHGYGEPIAVFHFIISHISGEKVDIDTIPMLKLNKALRTLGWIDFDEYSNFTKPPFNLSLNGANYIRSMAAWVHILLSKQNPYYFSQYKIRMTFFKYEEMTRQLAELFKLKFDPRGELEREQGRYKSMRNEIGSQINEMIDKVERSIFKECLNFTDHIVKTNYFMPTKTGLAFRLDPSVLDPQYYPQRPYGIFYIAGRDYRFFHVRWKDIARGGVRVVMPRSFADYDFRLAGLFDEVYGLSHAQQLKNKDIPEGGSKAVLLLKPQGHKEQAVRGAVNALLDLLVPDDELHATTSVVSYYDKDEIIYLGPDENMTNDLIKWIPEQAARRGYQYANAFMSSKPKDGINHKEYGVTSEGVHVFVDNVLKFLGIHPKKQRFTVKMTGGPDGDVAGNELRILYREYGENARVVAVSDGFGAAYDPEGLAWTELLRLFEEGKSIAEFRVEALSQGGHAFVKKADTRENIQIRDNLHATVYADIFIPAGGRPYTVTKHNWSNFLDADGKASTRAVVEGANIFFTAEARDKLQENGIIMVKDSSANKTGVICSSYEIIAALTLEPSEFIDIKDEYVQQVIDILRYKADAEAKLLFREYIARGASKTLVELSMDLSKEINGIRDVLLERFFVDPESILAQPTYKAIVEQHCPPILLERFSDRIDRIPNTHKIAIISASMASQIVYREGLGWLQSIPPDRRYEAATTYVQQDQLADQLLDSVQASELPNKDRIVEILKRSAARDLTLLELER